ncbi:hypothetical protein KM427_11690 [Nocardioides sp. LMS-CY]|uniref:Uncharacterized protein n=1 Tax=Nocardioides soli TaxID=1036020 RepID=A0A7W4VR37_9ACTN|nr:MULTISPECIES: hypothetical protein [Nocardioides]MBB3040210.1 hypothetical protein [Nocardioides soli]QWF24290.1 hypothetical protein KM427_11690 [Nocardioides sp. LMS-CY]
MDVVQLVDQSAATALQHASALQDHLRSVDRTGNPVIHECRAEMHRLVGDIVSLRNAAELLKRQSELDA